MRGCDWYGSAVNVAARLAGAGRAERGARQRGDRATAAGGRLDAALDDAARARAARRRPPRSRRGGWHDRRRGEPRGRAYGARAGLRARRHGAGAAVLRGGLRRPRRPPRVPRSRGRAALDRRSTARCSTISAFDVVDQVAEGDRVASRWVLTGSNRGRPVTPVGHHDQPPARRAASSRTGAPSTASSCCARSASGAPSSSPRASCDRCSSGAPGRLGR